MTQQKKFIICLGLLLALAVLAWRTMEPGRWLQLTWLILGFCAFRIVMSALRMRYDEERGNRN